VQRRWKVSCGYFHLHQQWRSKTRTVLILDFS
jgi:hypothetical protein